MFESDPVNHSIRIFFTISKSKVQSPPDWTPQRVEWSSMEHVHHSTKENKRRLGGTR